MCVCVMGRGGGVAAVLLRQESLVIHFSSQRVQIQRLVVSCYLYTVLMSDVKQDQSSETEDEDL